MLIYVYSQDDIYPEIYIYVYVYILYKIILGILTTGLQRSFKLVLSIFNSNKYLLNANIYTVQVCA